MPSTTASGFTRQTARDIRERVLDYIREGETDCADGAVIPWRLHPKYAYLAAERDLRWFKDGNVVIAAEPCQRARIMEAFCDIDQVPIPCIVRASAHHNRSPSAPRRCLICNVVDKSCGARVSVRQMQTVEKRYRQHQKDKRQRGIKRRVKEDEESDSAQPDSDQEEDSIVSPECLRSVSCMQSPQRQISSGSAASSPWQASPSSCSYNSSRTQRQHAQITSSSPTVSSDGFDQSPPANTTKLHITMPTSAEPYTALHEVFAEWERIASRLKNETQRSAFETISRSSLELSIARVNALRTLQK